MSGERTPERVAIDAICDAISDNGCDCDAQHDEDCDCDNPCFAHRIWEIVQPIRLGPPARAASPGAPEALAAIKAALDGIGTQENLDGELHFTGCPALCDDETCQHDHPLDEHYCECGANGLRAALAANPSPVAEAERGVVEAAGMVQRDLDLAWDGHFKAGKLPETLTVENAISLVARRCLRDACSRLAALRDPATKPGSENHDR